jgi:hypothetical protein
MAAGLGFKDFVTGEVLTAADVDGYLMQGIWVFDDAAARDAAVTSPEEGNFAFLKDTNTTTYYTGSVWTNLDTTGMVNPMTTTGDTIYSSSGSTPARLGIGGTGDVLTVAGGVPSWAAPAGGGGMTSLASGSLSGSSVDLTSISSSYNNLQLVIRNAQFTNNAEVSIRLNNLSTSIYEWCHLTNDNGTASTNAAVNQAQHRLSYNQLASSTSSTVIVNVWDYTNTTSNKQILSQCSGTNSGSRVEYNLTQGTCKTTNAINEINFRLNAGTFNAGTYILYGVK